MLHESIAPRIGASVHHPRMVPYGHSWDSEVDVCFFKEKINGSKNEGRFDLMLDFLAGIF